MIYTNYDTVQYVASMYSTYVLIRAHVPLSKKQTTNNSKTTYGLDSSLESSLAI
jgi:hypothetical protein